MKKIVLLFVLVLVSLSGFSQKPKTALTKYQTIMKHYIDGELYDNARDINMLLPYDHGHVYKVGKNTYIYNCVGHYFEVTFYQVFGTYGHSHCKTEISGDYYTKLKIKAIRKLGKKWIKDHKAKNVKIPYYIYK